MKGGVGGDFCRSFFFWSFFCLDSLLVAYCIFFYDEYVLKKIIFILFFILCFWPHPLLPPRRPITKTPSSAAVTRPSTLMITLKPRSAQSRRRNAVFLYVFCRVIRWRIVFIHLLLLIEEKTYDISDFQCARPTEYRAIAFIIVLGPRSVKVFKLFTYYLCSVVSHDSLCSYFVFACVFICSLR